jgi:hypothetical protein
MTASTDQKRAIRSHHPAGRPVTGITRNPRCDRRSSAEYAAAVSRPSVVRVSSMSSSTNPMPRLTVSGISASGRISEPGEGGSARINGSAWVNPRPGVPFAGVCHHRRGDMPIASKPRMPLQILALALALASAVAANNRLYVGADARLYALGSR